MFIKVTTSGGRPQHTPAPIRAEIDALMRKLDYLEGKRTLQSTEQFIELAASQSSSSGKPYFVKCGSAAAVPSPQWLLGQLQSLRAKPMSP